jgi:hypothetical protein
MLPEDWPRVAQQRGPRLAVLVSKVSEADLAQRRQDEGSHGSPVRADRRGRQVTGLLDVRLEPVGKRDLSGLRVFRRAAVQLRRVVPLPCSS